MTYRRFLNKSNTTGANSGTRTTYSSVDFSSSQLLVRFQFIYLSLSVCVLWVIICPFESFFLLATSLSVLPFTVSDYYFGILKLRNCLPFQSSSIVTIVLKLVELTAFPVISFYVFSPNVKNVNKKSWKITKGQSVYRRRTDNIMAKRKSTNNDLQNIYIKLKITLGLKT
jgi:hypothetical protein